MKIIEAKTKVDYQACLDIRMEVFVNEQSVPIDEEVDQYEEETRHYLLSIDGTPVATARTREKNRETLKIERVAVLKEFRGKGLGHELMKYLHQEAKSSGYKEAFLGAQKHAVPFYESLGYKVVSDMYYDAGIEHYDMIYII